MNRLKSLGIVLFFGFVFTECNSAPVLKLESDTIIIRFSEINHSISVKVKNDGDSPLIIEKIYSSCKCLNGEMKIKTIIPSENSLLFITVDDKTVKPKEEYFITLQTNDPEKSFYRVLVKVDANDFRLKQDLTFFPEKIQMLPFPKGGYSGKFLIKNEGEKTLSFFLEGDLKVFGLSGEKYFLKSGEKRLIELKSFSNLTLNKQKQFIVLVSKELSMRVDLPLVWEKE